MDNEEQNKTVVVEKERDHVNNSSPLGAIIGVIVLIALAVLAFNLFVNTEDNADPAPTTTPETTAPAENTPEPAPTENTPQ